MQSVHIDAAEVSIEVKEGKVTLEGTVPERRMKHAIEDMAEACPGVSDVENRLRVGKSSQRWGMGGEQWIDQFRHRLHHARRRLQHGRHRHHEQHESWGCGRVRHGR